MGFLKSKKKKQSSESKDKQNKRSFFGRSRKTTKYDCTEREVQTTNSTISYNTISICGNELSIVPSNDTYSAKDTARNTPTALLKNTRSFDERILATEKQVQREIRDLSSQEKDTQLLSSTGVLLFEGLNVEEYDDQSMAEIRESSDAYMLGNQETDFVDAPPAYDPVKSGFYSKKKKNYYDSDDEDDSFIVSTKRSESSSNKRIWGLKGSRNQPNNGESRHGQRNPSQSDMAFEPSVEVVMSKKR